MVQDRHDLTDTEWLLLEPLMPAHPPRGHRWGDHRSVINGILWRTRTGSPWRDLPECYGRWETVYGRHRRWSIDGTWEGVLDGLRAGCDEAEGGEWTTSGRRVWTPQSTGHTSTRPARPTLLPSMPPRGRTYITKRRRRRRSRSSRPIQRRPHHEDPCDGRPALPPHRSGDQRRPAPRRHHVPAGHEPGPRSTPGTGPSTDPASRRDVRQGLLFQEESRLPAET